MKTQTRILIADDHAIFREGVIAMLQRAQHDFHIEEASDFQMVKECLARQKIDILITDILMPKGNIIEMIRYISVHYPELLVLVISMYPEEQYASQLLKTGAKGYLEKNCIRDDLLDAVNTVMRGNIFVSKSLAGKIASGIVDCSNRPAHEALSSREFEVFLALANGTPIKTIAEELNLSSKTITTFRSRVLEKMKLNNNAEITRYAIEHQLI